MLLDRDVIRREAGAGGEEQHDQPHREKTRRMMTARGEAEGRDDDREVIRPALQQAELARLQPAEILRAERGADDRGAGDEESHEGKTQRAHGRLFSRAQAMSPMAHDIPHDQDEDSRNDHRVEAMEEVAQLGVAVPARAELLADIGEDKAPRP